MSDNRPRATAKIGGHPVHPMLVHAPIACFVGTLLTDIVYAATADMQWANMSVWLLTFGLLISVFVVIAGLIDFLGDKRIRALRAAWVHAVGNILVILLSILNVFVHSRDGYTSVVPLGLTLSALVVILLAVTGWNGWEMVYRYGVGVMRRDPS